MRSFQPLKIETFGFAYNDISTGESRVTILSANFDEVLNELAVLSAKEVVVASNFEEALQKKMRDRDVLAISFEDNSSIDMNFTHLLRRFKSRQVEAGGGKTL